MLSRIHPEEGLPLLLTADRPFADLVHMGSPAWVTSQPSTPRPRNQNSEHGVQGHECHPVSPRAPKAERE